MRNQDFDCAVIPVAADGALISVGNKLISSDGNHVSFVKNSINDGRNSQSREEKSRGEENGTIEHD